MRDSASICLIRQYHITAAIAAIELSPAFMVFEKIMQRPSSRSRSDLVSLARPFKAGNKYMTGFRRGATVEPSALNRRSATRSFYIASPALKGRAKLNRRYRGCNSILSS
jgi:hypothetical protein